LIDSTAESKTDAWVAVGVHGCDHVPVLDCDTEAGEQLPHHAAGLYGALERLN
jgi:hypothetical protein